MSDLLKTPLAEVRWCKLVGDPHPAYDATKPPEWSVDVVLDSKNPEHQDFIDSLEEHYLQEHGKKSKKSQYYLPIAPDKDNPDLMLFKMKTKCFTRKDGTSSEGPTIIDSNRNPWNGKLIGNGSKMIVAFDWYAWSGAAGCGLTAQPHMAMVVDLVEYNAGPKASIEDFDPIPGGYVETAEEELAEAMPF